MNDICDKDLVRALRDLLIGVKYVMRRRIHVMIELLDDRDLTNALQCIIDTVPTHS
jgi:hypothetical protein